MRTLRARPHPRSEGSGNGESTRLRALFYDYGYDITYAAYMRAFSAPRPEFLGRTLMTFLYVEIDPPYSVEPAIPGGAMREIGAQSWSRAVELWQRGLANR